MVVHADLACAGGSAASNQIVTEVGGTPYQMLAHASDREPTVAMVLTSALVAGCPATITWEYAPPPPQPDLINGAFVSTEAGACS